MFKSVVVAALIASASAFAPARPAFSASTALKAEWSPPEGAKWVEKDFEGELNKLEKEAEDRLDAKISELTGNIASTGTK
mmetsp:Transcript_11399/g.13789  ORF Transcript_11399/g.13789 Transcript_11399/m.13789 type:complete len:80 (-) Transcript_11399:302-541(-)|eukprot:CAMPEP_0195246252 /NCGR_PEP_ID=MMETSP0706-20130129/294_1 /TAXON_ID=33640 /ORGANISM="Asterionellopsis glacialis, Strain CCMP134" /LENGTH=79 /DNA_ID=CAMNT_0040297597 /DNA_START=111 /DNA_END=350 /DNA_ORIENTATION=-